MKKKKKPNQTSPNYLSYVVLVVYASQIGGEEVLRPNGIRRAESTDDNYKILIIILFVF